MLDSRRKGSVDDPYSPVQPHGDAGARLCLAWSLRWGSHELSRSSIPVRLPSVSRGTSKFTMPSQSPLAVRNQMPTKGRCGVRKVARLERVNLQRR